MTTRESRPTAEFRAAIESQPSDATVAPWYADAPNLIEWWRSPELAYSQGLADGRRLAAEEFDRELDEALRHFLHGGRDRREAVRRTLAELDRVERRRSWYADVAAERGQL